MQTLDEALAGAIEGFAGKRPKSRDLHERARAVMPGGNTRTVLFTQPFPIRAAIGDGAFITDVDGHRYLDLLGEYSAGILATMHLT